MKQKDFNLTDFIQESFLRNGNYLAGRIIDSTQIENAASKFAVFIVKMQKPDAGGLVATKELSEGIDWILNQISGKAAFEVLKARKVLICAEFNHFVEANYMAMKLEKPVLVDLNIIGRASSIALR